MDRSKWEYKKLGEVATFQNGFAFKSDLFKKEGLPIVRISNIQNEEIQKDDIVYFDKCDYSINLDNYRIFPDDILIAMSGGTTGKIGINKTNTTFYQNQRVGVIRENGQYLDHRFLFYFLHTKSEESLKIALGAAQPNLSTAQIKGFILPIPPIADQQRIVAELDCLNEMIAVKQEQLKEFDKLAQSIFYDMFLNDDNALFERVELKECVKEMHLGPFGSSLKNEFFVPKEEGYCMVYEQQHAIKKTMNLTTRYVDEEKYRELERFEVGPGDILMSCRGTIGEVYIIPDDAPKGIIHPSLMKIRLNPTYIEKTYFLFLLSHIIKDKDSNGATIKMAITAKELGKESIPLPPLSLQQQFADKISAIEAQKELVKQSIAETQALLDYTMDKYFG